MRMTGSGWLTRYGLACSPLILFPAPSMVFGRCYFAEGQRCLFASFGELRSLRNKAGPRGGGDRLRFFPALCFAPFRRSLSLRLKIHRWMKFESTRGW